MEILTVVKVLGIILSGASIVGAERLSKFETVLRQRLREPEKVVFGENIMGFFLYYGLLIFKILVFVSLFLLFVHLTLGTTLPKPVSDSLLEVQRAISNVNINTTLKLILCLLAAILIAPPIEFDFPTPIGTLRIPPNSDTLYSLIVFVFYFLTTALLRLISFPYIWLDKQVQKRKVESTLVVLGIVLAISGELIGYFIK